MKTGYSIRTWRMRLYCPEPEWLGLTEEYFQNVVDFYYDLLREHTELWQGSLFDIQRNLELLTLAGRDGRQPVNPLPMGKVPVYLRRAAINKAATAVKSALEAGDFPEKLNSRVTFFKGMYSDLSDNGICLKLWNGKKWAWLQCQLKGRSFPEDGQLMSPTLVQENGMFFVHIPVKQENEDGRTAKERMAEGSRICSVRFTNTDLFAMCCVLEKDGTLVKTYTCHGGNGYRHRCRNLTERIENSRKNTDKDNCQQPNRKYYMQLKHLSEHYAHQVSREILNFCKKYHAGVVVLPDYDSQYTKMAMIKSGNFSPLHLSTRIRSFLQYKAWAEGIVVLEVRTDGLSEKCAACGGKIHKKGKEFFCENGHQGNRFLNDARNLGKKCQESFLRNANK